MPPIKPSPPTKTSALSRPEVVALIDLQGKLLGESTERMHQDHSLQIERLHSRPPIKPSKSIEFPHADVIEMKARENVLKRANEALQAQVNAMAREIDSLKAGNAKLQDRMDYQEGQSRRNNMGFTGIPEESGENWQQCQQLTSRLGTSLEISSPSLQDLQTAS